MVSQKTLKFYVYVDGENDIPFFGNTNSEFEAFVLKNGEVFTTSDGFVFNVRHLREQIEVGSFRYDAKRMGGAPTITCTLMFESCLDDFWNDSIYALFNDERYFLKQTPTSSKSNEDARYKHELTLVSERQILDNTYYFDAVVGEPLENDKPVSNSTKFFFVGKIADFVKKINASLQYTKLQKVNEDGSISGYHVVLDEGMVSEDKEVSFDDAVISQALQECYNTFGIPFYFDGKTIHVGFTNNVMDDALEYGVDNALLSITRNNSNFKVVNRASGTGSSENIPYFYPNNSPKGDIEAVSSNPDLEVVIEDYEKYSNEIKTDESIRYGTKKTIENINTVGVFSETYIQETGHAFTAGVSATFISEGPTNVEAYFTPTNNCHFEVYTTSRRDGNRVEGVSFYDAFIENPRVRVYQDGVLLSNILTLQPFEEVKVNFFCNKSTKIAIVITMQAYPDLAVSGSPYKNVVSGNVDWEIKGYQDGEKALWLKEDKEVRLEDIGLSYLGKPQYEDTITQRLIKRVNVSDTLQPSIYRATDAKERFYNAINYPFEYKEGYELQYGEYVLDGQVHNDVYKKDDGTYYEFVTPYVEGHPREHVFTVDDIKPTIKEMTNDHSWIEKDSEGNDITVFQRIDMFSEFAYDEGDNDETYIAENGQVHFKHPYFFAKLRKLPFNLFDHASENGAMTFSMTSGNCGSCNFEIGVSEDEPQYNTVQVNDDGTLKRDSEGRVLCGLEDFQGYVPMQPRQQDTINNEVWIALKKEESTYGILMPKAPVDGVGGHRPLACSSENSNDGDTFVIVNINLPEEYIYIAERKLEKAIVKYIWENNEEKFNFSVGFSRIFLEENQEFLAQLNENARLNVRYNDKDYLLYVSSFSYQMSDGDILPSISIELDDTLTISQNALQQAIDGVKSEIGQAISALDAIAIGGRYFLRKDIDDTSEGRPFFKRGVSFGQGGEVNMLEDGSAKLSIDYLEVTKKATFTSLEIQEKHHVGGQLIISPAAMTCSDIAEVRDENGTLVAWRCYMQTKSDGEEVFNTFALDDQAICQTFDGLKNTYYWRLVVGVGEDYIDLSVEDCDEGSDVPSIGDKIVQLGNRRVISRQSAQVLSSHGDNAHSFIMYKGIDSFSLEGKDITGVTWNPEKQEPKMYSYGDFFFGDKNREKDYIAFENKEGEENKTLRINANVTIEDGSVMASRLDVGNPQDGNIEAFLNGGDFAKDDSERNCGKLILAAGIPDGDASELEDRAKQATTRIYEDGCVYTNNMHLKKGCTIGGLLIDDEGINVNGCVDNIDGSISIDREGVDIYAVKNEGGNCTIIRSCYINNKEDRPFIDIYKDDGAAIRIQRGRFEGLRTPTNHISNIANDGTHYLLGEYDFNVLFPPTGTYKVKLPETAKDGQEYWLETMGANITITPPDGVQMWSHTEGSVKTSHTFESRGVIRFKYYEGLIPSGTTIYTSLWTYTWLEPK